MKNFGFKRFALFAGSNYYPSGGWDDHQMSADSIEELRSKITKGELRGFDIVVDGDKEKFDWWQIVDILKREIVVTPWSEEAAG